MASNPDREALLTWADKAMRAVYLAAEEGPARDLAKGIADLAIALREEMAENAQLRAKVDHWHKPGTGWTRPDGEEFFGEEALLLQEAWWEDHSAKIQLERDQARANLRRVAEDVARRYEGVVQKRDPAEVEITLDLEPIIAGLDAEQGGEADDADED